MNMYRAGRLAFKRIPKRVYLHVVKFYSVCAAEFQSIRQFWMQLDIVS